MDSFSVDTTLTAADWRTYQTLIARKVQGDSHLTLHILLWLGTAGAIAVLLSVASALAPESRFATMMIGVFAGLGYVYARTWLLRRRYKPDTNGITLGPRKMTFAADGITVQRRETTTFMAWSLVKNVEVDSENVLIWLDRTSALMLPIKDLPNGMTADEAAARIRTLASQANIGSGIGSVASTAADGLAVAANGGPGAGTNAASAPSKGPSPFRHALGFLTLRPRNGATGTLSDWAVAGFTAGSLILWLLLDRIRYSNDAKFVPYDAPGFFWYLLPFLLGAWLASRLTRPRVEFRNILFLLVVAAPVLIGSAFLLAHHVPQQLVIAVAVALVVYAIVYLEVGLRSLAGRRQSAAVAAIIAVALLFVSLNSIVFVEPTLWSEPNPDTDYEIQEEKAESLLISQGPRIEAEVRRVIAADAGKPGVFFVGFAGVGRQKVFADEIKLAAARIADRYDSKQRQVLLLNDRRDLETHPLATVEGLKLALKDVAAKMDVERDVLFLSLSSHGSDEPSLSVSNTAVSLRDLYGTDLAEALRESGIKWKVIVISACHAGAFINSLRDDNTAILTAAAADRTSFGCSDDRELTYFGEAFYRDALPQAPTLQEAFDRASAAIADRESSEGIRASKPQGFFGTALQKKLAEVDSAAHCNNGCRQSVPESPSIR